MDTSTTVDITSPSMIRTHQKLALIKKNHQLEDITLIEIHRKGLYTLFQLTAFFTVFKYFHIAGLNLLTKVTCK